MILGIKIEETVGRESTLEDYECYLEENHVIKEDQKRDDAMMGLSPALQVTCVKGKNRERQCQGTAMTWRQWRSQRFQQVHFQGQVFRAPDKLP